LTLEEVNDKAVVTLPVQRPLLVARDLWRKGLKCLLALRRHLDLRLLLDPVQVLVQAVEHKGQELLRVVLLVARKQVVEADNALPECNRR
jgi:hypothetical protein